MKDQDENRKRTLDEIDTNEEDLNLNQKEEQDEENELTSEDKLALGQDDLSLVLLNQNQSFLDFNTLSDF